MCRKAHLLACLTDWVGVGSHCRRCSALLAPLRRTPGCSPLLSGALVDLLGGCVVEPGSRSTDNRLLEEMLQVGLAGQGAFPIPPPHPTTTTGPVPPWQGESKANQPVQQSIQSWVDQPSFMKAA